MSFKDEDWRQRFTRLGDEAEAVYEMDRLADGIGFIRAGLNRPPFNPTALHVNERYRPDYLEVVKGSGARYVEVQGLGRDGVFKLKVAKLAALLFWREQMPVTLLVWNNVTRTIVEPSIELIAELCSRAETEGEMGCFDGHHPYYQVAWTTLVAHVEERAPRRERRGTDVVPRAVRASARGGATAVRPAVRGGRGRGRGATRDATRDRGDGVLGGPDAGRRGTAAGDHLPRGGGQDGARQGGAEHGAGGEQ